MLNGCGCVALQISHGSRELDDARGAIGATLVQTVIVIFCTTVMSLSAIMRNCVGKTAKWTIISRDSPTIE